MQTLRECGIARPAFQVHVIYADAGRDSCSGWNQHIAEYPSKPINRPIPTPSERSGDSHGGLQGAIREGVRTSADRGVPGGSVGDHPANAGFRIRSVHCPGSRRCDIRGCGEVRGLRDATGRFRGRNRIGTGRTLRCFRRNHLAAHTRHKIIHPGSWNGDPGQQMVRRMQGVLRRLVLAGHEDASDGIVGCQTIHHPVRHDGDRRLRIRVMLLLEEDDSRILQSIIVIIWINTTEREN